MLILLLIVAAVIIYSVLQQAKKSGRSGFWSPETPLDILKKRHAGGEITKEEFERLKRDIEG
jgi:putative membrane protein